MIFWEPFLLAFFQLTNCQQPRIRLILKIQFTRFFAALRTTVQKLSVISEKYSKKFSAKKQKAVGQSRI